MMPSVHLRLLLSFVFSLFFACVVYADAEVQSQISCNVPVAYEGRPVNFKVDLPATLNQDDGYNFNVRFNTVVVPIVSCDVGRTKDPKGDNPCTVDEGYAISGIRQPQLVFTIPNPKKKDAGNYTFTLKVYGQRHRFKAICGLEIHAGKFPSDSSGHQTNQAMTETTGVVLTTADPGKTGDDSTASVDIPVPVFVLLVIAVLAALLFCLWKSQRFQKFRQWCQQRRQPIRVPDAERGDGPADGSVGNASTLSSRKTADGESFGGEDEDYNMTASQPSAQALLAGREHQGDNKDDVGKDFEIIEPMEQGECGDYQMGTRAVSGGWCRCRMQ